MSRPPLAGNDVIHVMPPGDWVAVFCGESDSNCWREPLVGWALRRDGLIKPLTCFIDGDVTECGPGDIANRVGVYHASLAPAECPNCGRDIGAPDYGDPDSETQWFDVGRESDGPMPVLEEWNLRIEKAYRRGFQQGVRAVEIVTGRDEDLSNVAAAKRFDEQAHRWFMHEFVEMCRMDAGDA